MSRHRACVAAVTILVGSACSNPQSSDIPLVQIGERALSVLSTGDEALWGVRDVVDLDGTIWALTTAAPHVHGFELTGGLSARFGAKGGGPGELRFPVSVWPGPHPGSVTLWDPGSPAALSFSNQGQFLSSSRAPTLGTVRSDIATVTFGHPFRAFRVPRAMVVPRYDSGVSHGGDLWTGRLILVSDDAGELLTIIDFARDLPGASHRSTASLLAPVPLWDGCPDGRIAVLDPVARQLLMVSRAGQILRAIPLPWESDALSQESRLAYLVSRIRAEVGDRDVAESEILDHAAKTARALQGLFAAEEPLAVDLKCSPDQVWIQEFDPDGHPLGYGPVWRTIALGSEVTAFSRVLFPADFNPHRISDSQAVGVLVDSLGYQRLAKVILPPTVDPDPSAVSVSVSPNFTQNLGGTQP